MKRIISVTREHGSGGREIAQEIAGALGWKLVDRLLIEEVARLAKVQPEDAEAYDERVDPWVFRMAKALWAGGPEAFTPAPLGVVLDADLMADLSKRVILEAASEGQCVIVGRGAPCILRGREDALHVFVYAPVADRVQRIRPRYPSESEAASAIGEIDRSRAAFVRHYYGCDRTDRDLYDLLINSRIGIEQAVRLILIAAGMGGRPA